MLKIIFRKRIPRKQKIPYRSPDNRLVLLSKLKGEVCCGIEFIVDFLIAYIRGQYSKYIF